MSFPTASLYNNPTEAGPEGDSRLTFKNIQNNWTYFEEFDDVFMTQKEKQLR
ncbi:MAG: hypothetical protein ACKOBL_09565 [Chloroflexota bacterium]